MKQFHIFAKSSYEDSSSSTDRYISWRRLQALRWRLKQVVFLCEVHDVIQTEGKMVRLHSMKAYRVSEGAAPLILNLGTRRSWMVSLAPWPVCSRPKRPHCPFNGRLFGPCSRRGRCDAERLLPLTGFEIWIDHPIACSMHRLSYPGSCCILYLYTSI